MIEIAETGVCGDLPPPYSNRGVTIGYALGDGPIFDAYLATVDYPPISILDLLEQGLMDAGHSPTRAVGPSVKFYDHNILLLRPDNSRLLSVRYGGQNGTPFVEAKGDASPVVAAVLRENQAEFVHWPSRVDSAYDLSSPTVFLELHKLALDFEARLGLKLDFVGAAVDNPDRGTTIYLGSRKSQAFVRIYQKGLQIAEEMGLSGDDIPAELRNWVRVELEYKPDKRPARRHVANLSPAALWGCSPWTRDFAKLALSIDAQRVKMTERRESNDDRARRYALEQYGPAFRRLIEIEGWDHFLTDFRLRLYPELARADELCRA